MKDVIGELLHAGMLEQIGDDEERVGRLRTASRTLSDCFVGPDRGGLPAALITAADGSGSVGSATLQQARVTLRNVWETIGNAYPEEPVELYRAVLLDAATSAFTSDDGAAAAGWYTLRSVVERLPAGRWAPVLRRLCEEWDTKVGPLSEQTLRADRPRSRRPRKAPLSEQTPIGIDSMARKRAATISDGVATNWQTGAQQLHQQLEELVDDLVTDAENAATEALRQSGVQMQKLAGSNFDDLRKRAEAQLKALDATVLRTELLWWHTTGYSTNWRSRYSDLTTEQATIAAALDVHHLVGGLCPVSVEHILNDTVEASTNREITLSELADCKWSSELAQDVEPAAGTILSAVVRGQDTPLAAGDTPLAPGKVAVLIFRDLQAGLLLAQEPA